MYEGLSQTIWNETKACIAKLSCEIHTLLRYAE